MDIGKDEDGKMAAITFIIAVQTTTVHHWVGVGHRRQQCSDQDQSDGVDG